MNNRPASLREAAWHFLRAIRVFITSEVGGTARLMLIGLVVMLLAINGMNVVNSYVGRDFMTAIADRNRPEFIQQAGFYLGVFAGATVLSVMSRFMEERLALLWREFLTRRSVDRYLADSAYYHLDTSHMLANPDQRISEDTRSFTVTTLSFVLMILNSSFTVFAFSGVLWAISPTLFLVAVLYAALGSLMTILLGRPLIQLNYDQLDKEANFRTGLIHVREHAEAILLSGSEQRLLHRLQARLTILVDNFRRIIGINRNLGFFTTWYNWLIQIIPALIVAPVFMSGKVEFGVVTQSAMAFSTLVAAFSLIVTQFQSISSFAAVVSRLSNLVEAVDEAQHRGGAGVVTRVEEGRLAFESLSLRFEPAGPNLIDTLSLAVPPRGRVLVLAENTAAPLALFHASAGLDIVGTGTVVKPGADALHFLAERPYLAPGTLREALVPPGREAEISDRELIERLDHWGMSGILARTGGLDMEQEWESELSLGEQQLLACIRVVLAAPRFVILDRPGTAMSVELITSVLTSFTAASIGYVQLGRKPGPDGLYDTVLTIRADGTWTSTGSGPQGEYGMMPVDERAHPG